MSLNRFLKAGSLSVTLLTMLMLKPWGSDTTISRDEELRVKSVLEQSLKTDPNNSEIWTHLGFTNRKLDDIDGAQAAFEKAVALNPKNADALYMLGLIYEKKKMTAEALKSWKTFLDVSNDKWKRDVAGKHIHHLNNNE